MSNIKEQEFWTNELRKRIRDEIAKLPEAEIEQARSLARARVAKQYNASTLVTALGKLDDEILALEKKLDEVKDKRHYTLGALAKLMKCSDYSVERTLEHKADEILPATLIELHPETGKRYAALCDAYNNLHIRIALVTTSTQLKEFVLALAESLGLKL